MKNFDTALGLSGAEPFTLGGQVFTPRRKVPFKSFGRVVKVLGTGDTEEERSKNLEEFYRFCLIKEDRDRFSQLFNEEDPDDDDNCVTTAQLGDLTNWLIEIHTGKQRESSGSSSNGSEPAPESSQVISLREVELPGV